MLAGCLLLTAPASVGRDGPVGMYREGDQSAVALSILPPGQGRHLNVHEHVAYETHRQQPAHNADQLDMYAGLVRAAPELTTALDTWFKDASFGVRGDDVEREYSPREGTAIIRDSGFGVPHVYGVTRDDVMFGLGYVAAEDRLFMMDLLRHLGRGRVSALLGASDRNLAADRAIRRVADYSEAELEVLGRRLSTLHGETGTRVLLDLVQFAQGVNTYLDEATADPSKLPAEYSLMQVAPRRWEPIDSIAVWIWIGVTFGTHGAGQVENALFLEALEEQGFPRAEARTILGDFRFANDAESPTTSPVAFPFNADLGTVDPDAVALPDDPGRVLSDMEVPGHEVILDGPLGQIKLPRRVTGGSNAILVAASRSATGNPLAVFGAQLGYFSPPILHEVDLHGPGVQARGVVVPGMGPYPISGRGRHYGWSLVSAMADQADIRAVRLCDTSGAPPDFDSTHYLDDNRCVPIESHTDTWLAAPRFTNPPVATAPEDAVVVSMTTERTRHGIVQARASIQGEPVAFVRQRATYGREIDGAVAFLEVLDPGRVTSIGDLQRALAQVTQGFDWLLLTDRDVGFVTSGLLPLMAGGVDPDLPSWGDQRWDWRGFLIEDSRPRIINPASGVITAWNNRQAPGFRAADDVHAEGPVHRKQLLDEALVSGLRDDGRLDHVELVQAVQEAATQDLRAARVLPVLLDMIGQPTEERLGRAVSLLRAWHAAGAHRRDLDGLGGYDHPAAVALLDDWWGRALDAVFRDVLGPAYDAAPLPRDDPPDSSGAAYLHGQFSHVDKELRQLLGQPVDDPFSRLYCGSGDLARCRSALLGSLNESVTFLETSFGPDPSQWRPNEARDHITFEPIALQRQRPIRWQNRPTFQLLIEFEEHGRATDEDGTPRQPIPVDDVASPPASLPTTGGPGLPLAPAGLLTLLSLVTLTPWSARSRKMLRNRRGC